MGDLLLCGGRPWGTAGPADILVRTGLIERIEPGIQAPEAETVDVSGRLVLPGLWRRTATWTRPSSAGSGCHTQPATR